MPFHRTNIRPQASFLCSRHDLLRLSVILAIACSSVASAARVDKCSPVNAVCAILRGSLKSQGIVSMSFLPHRRQNRIADPRFVPSSLTKQAVSINTKYTRTVTGPAITSTITAAPQTQTTTTDITEKDNITQVETYPPPAVVVMATATVTAATKTIYQKREASPNQRAIPAAIATFASLRISSA